MQLLFFELTGLISASGTATINVLCWIAGTEDCCKAEIDTIR